MSVFSDGVNSLIVEINGEPPIYLTFQASFVNRVNRFYLALKNVYPKYILPVGNSHSFVNLFLNNR